MATVSDDFERGVRAGAEAMRYYFLDENEESYSDEFPDGVLETFLRGAIEESIAEEQRRVDRLDK